MKIYIYLLVLILSLQVKAQDFDIYQLWLYEKSPNENVGFISLSDNYPLSEHPDSLAVPDVELMGKEEAEYFQLKGKYRKRFLDKLHILQNDKVFLYDYSTDALVSIPVKEINVVAYLNPYVMEDEWPFKQYDYMIGFEIDEKFLKKLNKNYWFTLIYIGSKSPFNLNQLKPIAWKEADLVKYPSAVFSSKTDSYLQDLGYSQFKGGAAYVYDATQYQYFLQEILDTANQVFARRLLVIDIKSKTNVCERLYYNSEGSSLAPLNYTNEDNQYPEQWTGQLFKNKPDVIFGFEYQSFGCPAITFIGKEEDLIINCDNRH